MMSDTDESAVLVDTPSTLTEPELVSENKGKASSSIEMVEKHTPQALQIVSIGTEEDRYAFHFDPVKMQSILQQIPPATAVAVVSVVGAFRTGKSFLLSWFLRYLDHLQQSQKLKGDKNNDKQEKEVEDSSSSAWYKKFQALGNDGFDWRAGAERNTTGIWMWSQPYILRNTDGSNIAVLLVDTQGMFDHETTLALTSSIFGFSTLLSSFQIYNVDKRIQEDNLQHLALFSEYARMAVGTEERESSTKDKEEAESSSENQKAPSTDDEASESATGGETADEDDKVEVSPETDAAPKPFQHIEFLVRDWQHFDEQEDDDEEGEEDYDAMAKSMETYLETVIAERDAKDLQDTRAQILSCFEKVSCYGLCHPGRAVTKQKYTGDVNAMDETFLQLLVRYCARVFSASNLQPKEIHGRVLTAEQLGVYVQAYADLFTSGASFPTASTMLEATASANNTNAVHTAVTEYKSKMDRIAGPSCNHYLRPEELKHEQALCKQGSLKVFESMATFGNHKGIDKARHELMEEITKSFVIYESLNESRNPLAGFEIYILPVLIALISFLVRWFTDATCSATVCRAASEVLSHIYIVVICFLMIIGFTKYQQIKDVIKRLHTAFEVMTNEKTKKD